MVSSVTCLLFVTEMWQWVFPTVTYLSIFKIFCGNLYACEHTCYYLLWIAYADTELNPVCKYRNSYSFYIIRDNVIPT